MVKVVLFDLDGTLLPMDQEIFVKAYFSGIATKMSAFGYDSEKLVQAIWAGTFAMIKNDGKETNERVFWQVAKSLLGEGVLNDKEHFAEFYHTDFNKIKSVCGFNKKSSEIVALLKGKGVRLVLATNPVFPQTATLNRINWAGLKGEDFEYITTYENSTYCKPSKNYYQEILSKIGVNAEDCLMIGNDVGEDMVAPKELGMKVFLLTDCLINKTQTKVSDYPNGSMSDLIAYLGEVI